MVRMPQNAEPILWTARQTGRALSFSEKRVYALAGPGGPLASAVVRLFGPRCLRFDRAKILALVGVKDGGGNE